MKSLFAGVGDAKKDSDSSDSSDSDREKKQRKKEKKEKKKAKEEKKQEQETTPIQKQEPSQSVDLMNLLDFDDHPTQISTVTSERNNTSGNLLEDIFAGGESQ